MAWQPMSTAPRDGTSVLVRTKDGRIYQADCFDNRWWPLDVGLRLFDEPPHWMPLPEAPQ